jgi:ubiquinone/menaquinone biosynthesis C-methylase UbiE
MAASSFSQVPEFDSELFEQVSDDELALLEYYRALRPGQRAALLEALVRMVEPARQAERHRETARAGGYQAGLR